MIREGHDNPSQQQEIDAVIIVTDQLDGTLLRRTAKLTLGDGVKIYGGTAMDLPMAAVGAAIIALKRRRHWDDVHAYEEGLTLEPPMCQAQI